MHWKSADTSILSSGKSMGSSCPSGPLCAGECGSLFDSRTHSGIADEVSDATAGASTGSSCPSGPLCAGECGSIVTSHSIGDDPSVAHTGKSTYRVGTAVGPAGRHTSTPLNL